jgi:hypothetical protein
MKILEYATAIILSIGIAGGYGFWYLTFLIWQENRKAKRTVEGK